MNLLRIEEILNQTVMDLGVLFNWFWWLVLNGKGEGD